MDQVPVPLPVILLAGASFLIFVAALLLFGGKRKQLLAYRHQVWREVAEKLGGEFEPGSGDPWAGEAGVGASLTAHVDGVQVRVRMVAQSAGSSGQLNTRLRAKATAPEERSLKVYAETIFSKLGRAVGLQDVQIGDDEFDDMFMVKADDEVFAQTWLNATVRRRMLKAPRFEYRLKGGTVDVEAPGALDDAVALEHAIRAVAAFADGKHHVVRVFKKLAKRLGGKAQKEATRWASLTADVGGTPVTVDTAEHGTTHFSVVTARVVGAKLVPLMITNHASEFSATLPPAEMAELPAGYQAWTNDPQRAGAPLTEVVRAQITALQPIKIHLDEQMVRVFSVGICPPMAEIQRAVKLATAIAAGAHDVA